jgi:hypothetical protein
MSNPQTCDFLKIWTFLKRLPKIAVTIPTQTIVYFSNFPNIALINFYVFFQNNTETHR